MPCIDASQDNNCFICSLEASRFERSARGFAYHTRYQHNQWHYVYLQAYLSLKEVRWL